QKIYHRLLNQAIKNKSSGSPKNNAIFDVPESSGSPNNNAIFDIPEVYERPIHKKKAIGPCFFHQ
ncbi:hypothetical protein H5410_009001, partial [Solanum commersonii]